MSAPMSAMGVLRGLVLLTMSFVGRDPERKWLRHSTLGHFNSAAFEKRAGLA